MDLRKVEGSTLILFLIATGVGIVGWASPAQFHPNIPLGQWKSFPSSTQCSTGNYTATNCELMGNTSYRAILIFASNTESGLRISLSLRCEIPSSVPGAFFQLQYANYSTTTHTNSSNFANLTTLKIDNSLNFPCPGNLSTVPASTSLPSQVTAFMFRVVGSNGGGIGDNPRFANIFVNIFQLFPGTLTFMPTSITTTGFTVNVRTNLPTSTAITESFQWIATNASSTNPGCGTGDLCEENGAGTCVTTVAGIGCTSAVTFATAFTGTVHVVGSGATLPSTIILPIGSLNMLSAQVLTV